MLEIDIVYNTYPCIYIRFHELQNQINCSILNNNTIYSKVL